MINLDTLCSTVQDTIHIIANNEIIQGFAVMMQLCFLIATALITILNRKRY